MHAACGCSRHRLGPPLATFTIRRDCLVTPPPIGERSIVMSVSVCLCVRACLSVRDRIFGTTRPVFTKCSVHVTYGRGLVLLRRRCGMLCTSGFMDGGHIGS